MKLRKRIGRFLWVVIFWGIGLAGCASQLKPARAIPSGDENTKLCKQSYLDCRSNCYPIGDDEDRIHCADLCERDVDTCLLQSKQRAEIKE